MRILSISTYDRGSGAEKVALDLHQGYLAAGHDARLVVKQQRASFSSVYTMKRFNDRRAWGRLLLQVVNYLQTRASFRGRYRMIEWLTNLALPQRVFDQMAGKDNYRNPFTRELAQWNDCWKPDVIHLHNLHGGYFDLEALKSLGATTPVIMTLHDTWLLTGHCAYFVACERWRIGCGNCPDLKRYPKIARDRTQQNFTEKRAWLAACSKLHVVTPSQWLYDLVKEAALPCLTSHHIPYGVNLSVFCTEENGRENARKRLSLPLDKFIVFSATTAASTAHPYKDSITVAAASRKFLAAQPDTTLGIFAGGTQYAELPVNTRTVGRIIDPALMADYYRAADVFIHAARADNFPCTVLEALACGTPVIATAVGGIANQIQNGQTGYLIPQGDSTAMANQLHDLAANRELCTALGHAAAQYARTTLDLRNQIQNYLTLFQEVS